MNVLNLISESSPAAASIHLVHRNIAQQLGERGVSVDNVLVCGKAIEGLEVCLGHEFDTLRRPRKHPLRYRRLLSELLSVVRDGAYDAVIVDGLLSANAVLSLGHKIPQHCLRVMVVHGRVKIGKRKLPALDKVVKKGFPDNWKIVAVSQDSASYLAPQLVEADSNLSVIENCLDGRELTDGLLPREVAAKALGVLEDAIVLGAIGRLSPEKNYSSVIKAFAAIDTSAQLLFIGDGKERASLEALAQKLDLASRVVFAGAIDGASRYLQVFDGFIMSSLTEGSPVAMIEAMLAGKPVIGSDIAPVAGVLPANYPYTFQAGNEDSLAACLRTFLDSSSEWTSQGRELAELAGTRFSPERFGDDYYDLLQGSVQ